MDIVFVTDDSYAPHLGAAIASILSSAEQDDFFNIYIVESRLSDENKKKFHQLKKIKNFNLSFIHIDDEKFKNLPVIMTNTETYFRYIFPEIFPKLKKILYLDSDIIVRSSLKKLWEIDVSNVYAGACENEGVDLTRLGVKRYFNADVMLFNLDKMRKDSITPLLFQNTIKLDKLGKLWLEDQDVLNYTFQENVLIIPYKYNYPAFSTLQEDTVIIHYVIFKPWKEKALNYDYYYRFRQMTPWRYTKRLYSLKGTSDEEFFTFDKNKNQFCSINNKKCGKVIPNITLEWDNGEQEVFAQIEANDFKRVFKSRFIDIKHSYWSDRLIITGNKGCRLAGEDCGTLLKLTSNKFVIKWDNWGEETFIKDKDNKFISQ